MIDDSSILIARNSAIAKALSMGKPICEAEDLAGNVVLKMLELDAIGRFNDDGRCDRWAVRVVRNMIFDENRSLNYKSSSKYARLTSLDGFYELPSSDEFDGVDDQWLAIIDYLRLDSSKPALYKRKELEGYNRKEIASFMGITERTAIVYSSRYNTILRKKFQNVGKRSNKAAAGSIDGLSFSS